MVWTELHAIILGKAFAKVLGKGGTRRHGLCALPYA